jgi:hypothetical protein
VSTSDGVSFDRLCIAVGLPRPVAEYQFALVVGRAWRFDWCWPNVKLAIEIDGGGFVRGRHHRHAGYMEDCIKGNEALILGWRVLHVVPEQVKDGSAFDFVRRALRLLDGL